ncbi:MAG: sel1 repeat family protein [Gammaproteobacteria bacterium]|nr:sel1 repeat family protein [Gammaproteobacteria bacterium]
MPSKAKIPNLSVALTALLLIAQTMLFTVSNTVEAASAADPLERGLNAYYAGDYKAAYNLTIPLASHGNAAAQNLLGMMYELGKGVPQNLAQSVAYYRKAAEQGDMYAQYNLAVSYDTGNGLPQNFREAVRWLRRAADQGGDFAQYNLGVMYEEGRGVKKDFKQAAQWYQQAAKSGHKQAQNNLGWLYETGQGVPQSLINAYAWFNAAAVQGFTVAAQKRDVIRSSLTKQQLRQAETLAQRVVKESSVLAGR